MSKVSSSLSISAISMESLIPLKKKMISCWKKSKNKNKKTKATEAPFLEPPKTNAEESN